MTPAATIIRRWRDDPVAFVRECLKAKPDAWQVEVLNALVSNNRICLKASKGPGKSTILAWAIWWFLATRRHPKVVATSITADNLKDNLWSELAKWQNQSPFLKEAFEWAAERVVAKDHYETWFASARTWPKSADPQTQGETLAGIHADNVLFVLDEAGGIPDAVMASAEGGLANASKEAGREAKLLIAGNPTQLSGPLYRACTTERPLWWVKEISGDPDDPNRAPRVSIDWAREQIAKYGRDNDFVLVNVFGQFPKGQSDAIMSLNDLTLASQRTLGNRDFEDEVKILGVDVARFGDDRTVVCLRQGRAVYQLKTFRGLDNMEVASQVAMLLNKHLPDACFIDQTGVGGGVIDRLRQLGFSVIGVDSAESAADPQYLNKRAEMWFRCAEWLHETKPALPDDNELLSELSTPTHKFTASNKRQVEGKPEIKKRTGVSPDKADALVLTFAHPVAARGIRGAHHARASTQAVAEYDPYQARP